MSERPVVYDLIAEAPTTQLRILTSIVLAVVYVLGAMVLALVDASPDGSMMNALGAFILGMMGADVMQYWAKRKTYKPSPPATPDIEDAPVPDGPDGLSVDRSDAEDAAIANRPRAA